MKIPPDIADALRKIIAHPKAKTDGQMAMMDVCLAECGHYLPAARSLMKRITECPELQAARDMTIKQLLESSDVSPTT